MLPKLLLLALIAMPPQQLSSYVDKNRVLLVFAPAARDPRYQQQMGLFAQHAAELKERDLIVLPVLARAGSNTDAQRSTRSRFHIAPDAFAVVLIGKDGGEKLKQTVPITLEKLSATIDAMPMRRDEMRDRKPK